MTRPKRTEGPPSKFKPRPLDTDLFHTLFDILHDGCMENNYAATARVLGINPKTVKRWAITAPSDPWLNVVLQRAITEVYYFLANSRHKKFRKRAANVRGQLHRSGLSTLTEVIEDNEANNSGAVRHLLISLNEAPGQELSTRDLRKPAYSGGYSLRMLRQAADIMELERETTGFGEDKQTFYRLPRS